MVDTREEDSFNIGCRNYSQSFSFERNMLKAPGKRSLLREGSGNSQNCRQNEGSFSHKHRTNIEEEKHLVGINLLFFFIG